MLRVIDRLEADALLQQAFPTLTEEEQVPLQNAAGRFLYSPLLALEDLPPYNRSTVDGYAHIARDSHGASPSLPALLQCLGEVPMGHLAPSPCRPGTCQWVPTGACLSEGADAVVMVEDTEDYGEGLIGFTQPCSKGSNMVYRGHEFAKGEAVLPRGHRLRHRDIGALSALGIQHLSVHRQPVVAILSTGEELVSAETQTPAPGAIRDCNSPMLASAVLQSGGIPLCLGIVPDQPEALAAAIQSAIGQADLLLLSGGSSVGHHDFVPQVLAQMGELLFHGLALKPGKPTMAARVQHKPVLGLPGHPLAAALVFHLLGKLLLQRMMGGSGASFKMQVPLTSDLPNNHGREACVPVRLLAQGAKPLYSPSGFLNVLLAADGYILVPRGLEGQSKGTPVNVHLFAEDL